MFLAIQHFVFWPIIINFYHNALRLIIELSYLEGHSINDGLETKVCTMKHTFVVAVVATVLAHGTCTYLEKFNIEVYIEWCQYIPLLGIK